MVGESEIQGLMQTAMSSLRELVDVNAVVGDVIRSEHGVSVIPVSKVLCGFIAGGGEFNANKQAAELPFAGGSGAGICVQPVGFLIVQPDGVRLIPVCGAMVLDKAIESVPLIADSIESFINKLNKKGKGGIDFNEVPLT